MYCNLPFPPILSTSPFQHRSSSRITLAPPFTFPAISLFLCFCSLFPALGNFLTPNYPYGVKLSRWRWNFIFPGSFSQVNGRLFHPKCPVFLRGARPPHSVHHLVSDFQFTSRLHAIRTIFPLPPSIFVPPPFLSPNPLPLFQFLKSKRH